MSLKESVTPKDVVKLMNELLAKDSDCIHKLINTRVKCNIAIAVHPTVQVQQYKKDKFTKVGLLGIINGLFGIREDGMGAVCIDVDDSGKILKFKLTPKK